MITVGAKVKISKGCKALDIAKNVSAKVVAIKELGADYCYNVSVTLEFTNGYKAGRSKTLQARHPNRLQANVLRLLDADPTRAIEIVVVG
jgi:hypothetical protein